MRRGSGLLALLALAGCWRPACCPDLPDDLLARAPARLSQTGLYADLVRNTLAPGVEPYTPAFELWSDGAHKRRWILLPPGTRIDTSDMDAWQFPVGTKVWKEFIRDGVRVETRLLEKFGPDPADWVPAVYLWDADGREARLLVEGREQALGTRHDVPPVAACQGCHEGVRSRVLGVSAIQLAHDAPPGELTLSRLVAQERLTQPPAADPVLPGDATTRAALGYLHANCAHCHNQDRPEGTFRRCWDPWRSFDLSLRVGQLARVEDTPVYRTTLGNRLVPGAPWDSTLFTSLRYRPLRDPMPPLAVKHLDPEAERILGDWIRSMPPAAPD